MRRIERITVICLVHFLCSLHISRVIDFCSWNVVVVMFIDEFGSFRHLATDTGGISGDFFDGFNKTYKISARCTDDIMIQADATAHRMWPSFI
jgi:hypothetical protein